MSNPTSIAAACENNFLVFGGLDIVVHSADLTISKPLVDISIKD
ncbi:MAG: hypothetical protein ABI045_04990 [Flavobacteriales bacterium]